MIEDILGPRPFGLSKQHEEYIREKRRIAEDIREDNKPVTFRGDWVL